MSLKDLSTAPLTDEVDFANMPEAFGTSAPPPPPGDYRFALPKTLGDANFDEVVSEQYGKRVKVVFNDAAPLKIVQSVGAIHDGEPFKTSLSNIPRARNKEKTLIFSDWDQLNQALGEAERPKGNLQYAQTLLKHAAAEDTFAATMEWSWGCNDKRAARFDDGNGGTTEVTREGETEPAKGCGRKYYQSVVQKVNGEFPLRIACECGASIRAFGNLTKLRK